MKSTTTSRGSRCWSAFDPWNCRKVCSPTCAPLSSPIGEIYRVYLKSDKYDAMELRTLEDWVVERHLKMVPGVADVVTRGGFIKQYQVVPDMTRMRSHGVTMQQIFAALSSAAT